MILTRPSAGAAERVAVEAWAMKSQTEVIERELAVRFSGPAEAGHYD
jgi:hypothetical protein